MPSAARPAAIAVSTGMTIHSPANARRGVASRPGHPALSGGDL